jgi:hypothetical protein
MGWSDLNFGDQGQRRGDWVPVALLGRASCPNVEWGLRMEGV